MDNIQLYYIDNEINKIDKMKQGDVIYKNGVELLVVLSYDHNEPCKGCFFYEDKACGSERLIKCWDCKKEYIFTAIRKYNTTEMCGIVKRYEETMPRNYSRTRAWGCAANAGGWLPALTAVMSWCPENGTGSSRRRKLPKSR
jgi:hypothetical protein